MSRNKRLLISAGRKKIAISKTRLIISTGSRIRLIISAGRKKINCVQHAEANPIHGCVILMQSPGHYLDKKRNIWTKNNFPKRNR